MNTKRIIYILTVLFLMVQEASAYSWTGSGTSNNPYQLSKEADWNELANNAGSYSGKYFKMTANISVTTMVTGTFTGTFDGGGKTLSFNPTSTGSNIAPFVYLNGGTIRNLTVTGKVISKGAFSSGLVSHLSGGDNLIEGCTVNVTVAGVGFVAGVVGHAYNANSLTIRNCVCSSNLESSKSSSDDNYGGGFVGWYNNTSNTLPITITDCLFKGTYSGGGIFHPIGVKKVTGVSIDNSGCARCYYTANPSGKPSSGRIVYGGTKVSTLITGTTGVSISSGSYATFQNTKYYYGAIKLAYNHADATVKYTVEGTTISGNSFTINTGAAFTSGIAIITADVSYTITYNLNGGSLNASERTYTNPTEYSPDTNTFTLRNPHKDGYAFYGWTGTGLTTGATSDRRKNVNVTIAKGSAGNRTYTADFREYTEGPWHFEGIQTGICSTSINPTLSYDGMIYNTVWMNPYPWQDGGFGFTEWGTSGDSGNKYGLYSVFKTNQSIPSYTRKVLHWKYQILSSADKFQQTVALYVHDNFTTLKAMKVDMTAGYTNGDGSSYCISHYTHSSTSPTQQTTDLVFDNRSGSGQQTMSKAMLMTQVIASTQSGVEMHHWGGFKSVSMTWDTYYYKTVTFNANGGTGTMANQTIENSGKLTANAFTRTGYTFAGWSTSANGSVAYADKASITATASSKGPVTLYARWTPINYTITYTLNEGTATNPTSYNIETATFKLNNPVKPGYAFWGWTGTGLHTGNTADRRANVNVSIAKGSTGNRTYAADFRQFQQGPWTYECMQTGAYGRTTTPSASYNSLNGNPWMNPYPWNDGTGLGQTTWGNSVASQKLAVFYISTCSQDVPSYTRRVLSWKYQISAWANTYQQTWAVYAADNLATLKATTVDLTADYSNRSGSTQCLQHETQTTPGSAQTFGPYTDTFDFDNRNGSSQQTKTQALMLTQVIDNPNTTTTEMHHWLGFKDLEETVWTNYYYKYVTFNSNGGTGSMAQQEIENSGMLTANAFTRSGYTFAGWSTTQNGSVEYADQAAITATVDNKGPVTLYAQWIQDEDHGAVVIKDNGTEKTAVLDGASNADFSITSDITVEHVSYNRTFGSGKKTTVCLPFEVTAAEAAALGKFYEFKGINSEGKIEMQEIATTTNLLANTPYIFESANDITDPILFGAKTLKAGGPLSVGSGYTFKGIYRRVKWTTDISDPLYDADLAGELGRAYGFALENKTVGSKTYQVGQFVRLGSGAHSRPFRAYLLYDGTWDGNQPSAPRRSADEGSLPGKIEIVWLPADGATSVGILTRKGGGDNWYSLDGQKLNGKPSAKGVYIHNGHKVVIK